VIRLHGRKNGDVTYFLMVMEGEKSALQRKGAGHSQAVNDRMRLLGRKKGHCYLLAVGHGRHDEIALQRKWQCCSHALVMG
jgi:hypothetical protein